MALILLAWTKTSNVCVSSLISMLHNVQSRLGLVSSSTLALKQSSSEPEKLLLIVMARWLHSLSICIERSSQKMWWVDCSNRELLLCFSGELTRLGWKCSLFSFFFLSPPCTADGSPYKTVSSDWAARSLLISEQAWPFIEVFWDYCLCWTSIICPFIQVPAIEAVMDCKASPSACWYEVLKMMVVFTLQHNYFVNPEDHWNTCWLLEYQPVLK